jgi:cold shock CspA family protein
MSLVGVVDFFDMRKGWGFIKVLTQDTEHSNEGVFFHRQSLNVQEGSHKSVFPGEYVSFSLGKNEKGDMCIDITGIMGGPLLTDHPQWHFTKKAKRSRPVGKEEGEDVKGEEGEGEEGEGEDVKGEGEENSS